LKFNSTGIFLINLYSSFPFIEDTLPDAIDVFFFIRLSIPYSQNIKTIFGTIQFLIGIIHSFRKTIKVHLETTFLPFEIKIHGRGTAFFGNSLCKELSRQKFSGEDLNSLEIVFAMNCRDYLTSLRDNNSWERVYILWK